MSKLLRKDAHTIIQSAIEAVMPEQAVKQALMEKTLGNSVTVIAIGKGAWNMSKMASDMLGDQIRQGLVVTKYEHSKGQIPKFEIIEAGHPLPDANSVKGAERAIELVEGLNPKHDEVLFLVSGGGSALFEATMPGVTFDELVHITDRLLRGGANIGEMNTVRKHLSAVKGGRFAEACKGCRLFTIMLSDVIGDHPDIIASGPSYPDTSTSAEALEILKKYDISISESIKMAIMKETPKKLEACEYTIAGSVSELCRAAIGACEGLGYRTILVSSTVEHEAKDTGKNLAVAAKALSGIQNSDAASKEKIALVLGGETVVKVVGKGKGGRNQELALSAAIELDGTERVVVFSVGSDGTDGPTDAAGGIVDGKSAHRMRTEGVNPVERIVENDAYYALKASGDLIITGPTGTNVNDIAVALIG